MEEMSNKNVLVIVGAKNVDDPLKGEFVNTYLKKAKSESLSSSNGRHTFDNHMQNRSELMQNRVRRKAEKSVHHTSEPYEQITPELDSD